MPSRSPLAVGLTTLGLVGPAGRDRAVAGMGGSAKRRFSTVGAPDQSGAFTSGDGTVFGGQDAPSGRGSAAAPPPRPPPEASPAADGRAAQPARRSAPRDAGRTPAPRSPTRRRRRHQVQRERGRRRSSVSSQMTRGLRAPHRVGPCSCGRRALRRSLGRPPHSVRLTRAAHKAVRRQYSRVHLELVPHRPVPEACRWNA